MRYGSSTFGSSQSAQPCGCDAGAHHLCARHQWEHDHHIQQFEDDGGPAFAQFEEDHLGVVPDDDRLPPTQEELDEAFASTIKESIEAGDEDL